MSLNHAEIDLVLSELDLSGMAVEKVLQPSYDSIVLSLFGRGRSLDLLISTAHGACRLHQLSQPVAKNERPLRFMECLRSRIRGGRIESCVQLGSDRIVKFSLTVPRRIDASPEAPIKIERFSLYARLWSGAGNIVLVDESGTIVDSLVRNPKKGEVSGVPCAIEEDLARASASPLPGAAKTYKIRDLPGEGGFSRRVEAFYMSAAGEISRENLLETARERYGKKSRSLGIREAELSNQLEDFKNANRYREIGDILMAGYEKPALSAEVKASDARSSAAASHGDQGPPEKFALASVFDFYRGEALKVQVNPALSNVENAKKYYEKYKKAVSGRAELEEELEKCRESQRALSAWLKAIEEETDPYAMAKKLEKAGTTRTQAKKTFPCLHLESDGWVYLVGRSGKENDELLRRHVVGSDLWLHARDYSGSYVFVKNKRGKSFPLEVMVNAATLAVYYSKARKNQEGDVFYTQSKYLRRVKGGPVGLVIPSQEKNLHVKLNEGLVRSLLANAKRREDNA